MIKPENMHKYFADNYLCPGCSCGTDTSTCTEFRANDTNPLKIGYGFGCTNHAPGTLLNGYFKIMLGFPKGFCRIPSDYCFAKLCPKNNNPIEYVFSDDFEKDNINNNKFVIPVWKYLDRLGNTIVKSLCPRINKVVVTVYYGDYMNKIYCFRITDQMMNEMD